ncbi:hypothetical protein [Staphylococcus warneri]|nr:hypothetical protein [Staphylococcus warneri]
MTMDEIKNYLIWHILYLNDGDGHQLVANKDTVTSIDITASHQHHHYLF